MTASETVMMAFSILGGLGIFLLGMKNMSEGMQAVAGTKLRTLINAVTNNRFVACGLGALITCLIQSSSVTTVMVVGMVNASLMNLTQAVGVIMGANIGTTITGWIIALKVGKYGLPIIGVTAMIYLFSKRERLRYLASMFLGIGMVFFGLQLMKNGFAPLKDMPGFEDWFKAFAADSYLGVLKCCLVGAALTAIVQSSSATLGITMALAATGAIPFQTAAALVLGENIGTTITAMLASIGASTNAKRAAYAHALINIIGVLWITTIFGFYVNVIERVVGHDPDEKVIKNASVIQDDSEAVPQKAPEETYPYIERAIALTHTGFNVANTAVMLFLMGPLCKLLVKLAPDKGRKEKPHLTYLDVRMLDTPAIGLQQSKVEIMRMGDTVLKMLNDLGETIGEGYPDEKAQKKAFTRENTLDVIQKEIVEFLSHLLSGTVPQSVMADGRRQLRMADEFESIGDYATNLLKMTLKMRDANLEVSEDGQREIRDLHDHVAQYIQLINEGVTDNTPEVIHSATVQGEAITHLMKEYRSRHLERVEQGLASPLKSLIYTDMLNAYRRIKDHALNIAEAMAGEK